MIDPRTRARLFNAQYQSFDGDIPFWSGLASETGDPILEMGCGTGRLVRALASKGYRVLGLDHDTAMLTLAKSRLNPDLTERVTWIEQDLASFSWDGSICIAIGALNTFAYLNDSDFCSALKSVKAILMDQGLIALDLPPDDADHLTLGNDEVPLDVFDDPEHGTSIELRARVTAHIDEQVDVSWIYDEIFPDGIVNRYLWEQTYYQRSEDTLHRLIHASGFTIRSTYGDYDASPYQGGSQRRLVILEKQNEGA
jgi:cyclopropane fatty-acyl-phospholipid synthase-like methyltransferase